jgi:hypothetical protein
VTPDLGLQALPQVDLATLVDRAALTRRVDRKYVVPIAAARGLVESLARTHHVLAIDGRLVTSYRSTYLDTASLRSCREHLQGRRLRWKARTRLYVEDDLCRVEVKIRSGRGDTVKSSVDVESARYGRYDDGARAFIDSILTDGRGDGLAHRLRPTLEVTYRRVTLADLAGGTRVTLDLGMRGRPVVGLPRERGVHVDDGYLVVETKGHTRPAPADRALVALGHRPRPFSKYAASASLLSPDLPDNHVRRLLGQALHVSHPDERRAS